MKIFNKTRKNISLEKKFDYIKNHFQYWTMNSWNRLKSIANNVKVYKLGLTNEQIDKFFELTSDENLSNELYLNFESIIDNFNFKNPLYHVVFNGRSIGYLVLTNTNNNENIINEDFEDYENFKDFKKHTTSNAKDLINETFEIITKFDNLCDDLVSELKYILDNSKITVKEITTINKVKKLIIT